jgi:hypothetical protein
MDHDIESEFQRALNPGTGEGIIANGEKLILRGESSNAIQVDQF